MVDRAPPLHRLFTIACKLKKVLVRVLHRYKAIIIPFLLSGCHPARLLAERGPAARTGQHPRTFWFFYCLYLLYLKGNFSGRRTPIRIRRCMVTDRDHLASE